MSKRNSDGDVLVNRVNIALAKHQKALAAMLGASPEPSADTLKDDEERAKQEELEDRMSGFEQLGVGGQVPKDIADGSFTRRTLTSNDKLLQQLLGKKAAKAHMAAKQTSRSGSVLQSKPTRRPAKPEESEDEEEGRAAVFKSKRKKSASNSHTSKVESYANREEDLEPEDAHEAIRESNIEASTKSTAAASKADSSEDEGPQPKARSSKSRPGSYLDEILAGRSKKQKKKKGTNA